MFLNHKIKFYNIRISRNIYVLKILPTNIKYFKLFGKLRFIIKIKQT